MSDVIKAGIIGLGTMGRVMLEDMQNHESFEVSAAWDPGDFSRDEARKIAPNVRLADSSDAVISTDGLNLIYIASPPNTHFDYCTAAFAAGLPVLCEKPLGVDLDDSRALVRKAEAAGLTNLINFNHGAARSTAFVEEMIAEDRIGAVTGVDIFIHLHTWPRAFQTQAQWLARKEQGGFTREMLSHWTYLTRRLFGEGKILSANPVYNSAPNDCETAITADLTFGPVPTFMRAFVGGKGPVGTEYTIWGEKASVRMNSGGQMLVAEGLEWSDAFAGLEDTPGGDRFRNLDAVAAEMAGTQTKMPRLADGLAVQEIIEALLAG